uniref:Cytoplasmic tRNA 2-thiolation protein 2 n=1 Tax=Sphaeramia orbicularis TaxID=375764 RepID=A0A673AZ00_9TELE
SPPQKSIIRVSESKLMEYFIHKFRAMLGKNRIIFPGEKVLLAVSGGPSSCSMLSQVQEGLSQNAHKKLRFIPGIVYIDEGAAAGRSVDDRKTAMAQMQTLFEATGFPFHLVPLEQVLDLSPSVLVMAPSPSEQPGSAYKAAVDQFIQSKGHWPPRPQDQDQDQDLDQASLPDIQESHTQLLQQLMSSTKTQTAREELLSMLRQHLLVHTARTKGYSKLMLGDCCSRLAVKLLSSIALGRGAQLAQDTGFSDSRYGDIITVRPMRDYSSKEIVFYNHMFKVPSIFIPGLDTMTADKSSIQRLTESFVTKLQADFPSTVSTIYRTSEKLQTAWKGSCAADVCDTCLLCLCMELTYNFVLILASFASQKSLLHTPRQQNFLLALGLREQNDVILFLELMFESSRSLLLTHHPGRTFLPVQCVRTIVRLVEYLKGAWLVRKSGEPPRSSAVEFLVKCEMSRPERTLFLFLPPPEDEQTM